MPQTGHNVCIPQMWRNLELDFISKYQHLVGSLDNSHICTSLHQITQGNYHLIPDHYVLRTDTTWTLLTKVGKKYS
jgi:hypothetical protein